MNNLLILLGAIGPISLMIALVVIALLSQRLGAVTKQSKLYRLFYVAVGLVGAGVLVRLLMLGGTTETDTAARLLYNVPIALALTLSVSVAWRYWGWLLSEHSTAKDTEPETEQD